MTRQLVSTLLEWFEQVAPAFTRPSFRNALVVFLGWVQICGGHAITEALVVSGVAGRRHHEAFHRLFSRNRWNRDGVGRLLFRCIVGRLLNAGMIEVVIDDTLARKSGPEIHGLGTHVDPVQSTRKWKVLSFGHVWVVLSVVVKVPFSQRSWALPVLFRLYRSKKECERRGATHYTKSELARQMLEVLHGWRDGRRIRVTMDSAYSNRPLMHPLLDGVTFVGALWPKAKLYAKCPTHPGHGQRRFYGEALPKPKQILSERRYPWHECEVCLYGRTESIRYKVLDVQWRGVMRQHVLRAVFVQTRRHDVKLRAYFSTDPTMTVPEILETYARRWSTEVCFRDLKQQLGFADSQARKPAAVERTAPFVGYSYTTLVLWFSAGAWESPLAKPPLRPWYTQKKDLCFTDIVRCARRALEGFDVLDPVRGLEALRKKDRAQARHGPDELRVAA
jgi:DDE superfamily endonuclease